jgi:hypothetical protein
VGFEEPQKTSKKGDFSGTATQNPTHSSAEVAHAVQLMSLISRLAALSPESIAVLHTLFNGKRTEQ